MSLRRFRWWPFVRSMVSLIAIVMPSVLAKADSRTMVFRFRPASKAPAWTNPVVYEGGATPSTASTPLDIETLNPLNQDFAKVELDGVNDRVRATSAIRVRRGNDGPGAFTTQIWFRPDRIGGKQTLISNAVNGGFSLYLDGDKLAGLAGFGGRYVTVTGSHSLKVGKWYVATLIASELNFETRYGVVSLLLDGESDGFAYSVISPEESLSESATPPMIGAQPGQPSLFFKGRIHAAAVRNYAMNGSYAQARVLHDGGELMGAAAFDDGVPYGGSGEDAWIPPDLAVDWTPEEGNGVTARAFVPFTSDDYIVQGVAHSCEGGQSCTRNVLYLSHYWHTAGDASGAHVDETASPSSFPENRSIVTEVDLDQMRITRCWRLAGTSVQSYGHLGGMAYFNGALFIASDHRVGRYSVGRVPTEPLAPGANCGELELDKANNFTDMVWSTATAGFTSFSFINGEPSLIVGSNGGGAGPWAYRYALTSDGGLRESPPFGYQPVEVYWLPISAQGVEVFVEDGVQYVVASTSKGVYKYRAVDAGGKPPNDRIQFFPVLSSIPRGIEDTARVGSTYWSASESGARYYQRRPFGTDAIDPWDKFYPFIFTFDLTQVSWQAPTDADFEGFESCHEGLDYSSCSDDEVWAKRPGCAKDIAAGADGSTWVVGCGNGSDAGLHKWNGASWDFASGGGFAARIAVDVSGVPWVVNSQGGIYRRTSSAASVGNWVQLPGCAKDIGAGADGSVWVIGCDATAGGFGIHKWNGSTWTHTVDGGGATHIAVAPDGVPWLVNSAGSVFRRTSNSATSGSWSLVIGPQAASDIGIGSNRTVWVTGWSTAQGGHPIFFLDPSANRWVYVPGGGTNVSVAGRGTPWLTDSAGVIYSKLP